MGNQVDADRLTDMVGGQCGTMAAQFVHEQGWHSNTHRGYLGYAGCDERKNRISQWMENEGQCCDPSQKDRLRELVTPCSNHLYGLGDGAVSHITSWLPPLGLMELAVPTYSRSKSMHAVLKAQSDANLYLDFRTVGQTDQQLQFAQQAGARGLFKEARNLAEKSHF
jgi:hypothetical protein